MNKTELWVMVPMEPTDEMIEAVGGSYIFSYDCFDVRKAYDLMIASAPKFNKGDK